MAFAQAIFASMMSNDFNPRASVASLLASELVARFSDSRPCLPTPDFMDTNRLLYVWAAPTTPVGSTVDSKETYYVASQRGEGEKVLLAASVAALLLSIGEYDEASGKIVVASDASRRGVVDRLNGEDTEAAKSITPLARDVLVTIRESLPKDARTGICVTASMTVVEFIASRMKKDVSVLHRTYGANEVAHLGVFYDNAATLLELCMDDVVSYDIDPETKLIFEHHVKFFASHTRLLSAWVHAAERRFTDDSWVRAMEATILCLNKEAYELLCKPEIIKRVKPALLCRVLTRNADVRRAWTVMMTGEPTLPTDWLPVSNFLDQAEKNNWCDELESPFWVALIKHILSKATLSQKHKDYLLANLKPAPLAAFKEAFAAANAAESKGASEQQPSSPKKRVRDADGAADDGDEVPPLKKNHTEKHD